MIEHPQLKQGLIIVFISLLALLLSKGTNTQTTSSTITQLVANCEFSPGGKYELPPYPRSIDWCMGSDTEPLFAIMAHMHIHTGDAAASFAAEFGSYVRVVYLPSRATFLINPLITATSGAMDLCEDTFGFETIVKMRPRLVNISHISADLAGKQISSVRVNTGFSIGESCYVQAIYEKL